jgi:serine/threonine protein kinase
LIADDERACLSDSGLSSFTSMVDISTSAGWSRGTTSWMAPELYNIEDADRGFSSPSEESDIYAFGMVVVEVLPAVLEGC